MTAASMGLADKTGCGHTAEAKYDGSRLTADCETIVYTTDASPMSGAMEPWSRLWSVCATTHVRAAAQAEEAANRQRNPRIA